MLARRIATRQRKIIAAQSDSIQAPVKGWNVRDAEDDMDDGYATILDNWFPRTGYVESRNGHAQHATGVGSGDVETTIGFDLEAGTTRLLAAGGGAIYNATATGAATSLGSGFSSNRWQHTVMNDRVLMVNGSDTPQAYDGTTLSANTWTGSGLTATDLIDITNFKSRVFAVEKDSRSFWYGSINEISGTLTEFDLSFVGNFGGYLLSVDALTRDGGSGADDFFCAIFSTGEVVVYQGTDPGDASAWSLVGIFNIGRPVSRRAKVKIGGDLIIATDHGYLPMTQFLALGQVRTDLAISDAIKGAVASQLAQSRSVFGWDMVHHPNGQKLFVNAPIVGSTTYYQHVMNTQTKAWCRFKGFNGVSWGTLGGDLYFGGTDGKVYKADSGLTDNGSDIAVEGKTAFKYYGGRSRQKLFDMVRPRVSSTGNLSALVGVDVDFADSPATTGLSATAPGGTEWDTGDWDTSEWAGGDQVVAEWSSVGKYGYNAAVKLAAAVNTDQLKWYATDMLYQKGDFL